MAALNTGVPAEGLGRDICARGRIPILLPWGVLKADTEG